MNNFMKKQILDDYTEILSKKAGLRIFGGIFFAARINGTGLMSEYYQGRRDLGVEIANTIREINPRMIADCEIAYREFIKENSTDERRSDDSGDY